MADIMSFQDDWHDFLEHYSFKDRQECYTNGSMLIPTFRVEQMIEHYFERTCTFFEWRASSEDECEGWYCSNCRDMILDFSDGPKYCPNCGAKAIE